jgi:hypothetical protein
MKYHSDDNLANIKIIEKSDLYAIPPIVTSKNIEKNLRQKLQDIIPWIQVVSASLFLQKYNILSKSIFFFKVKIPNELFSYIGKRINIFS